jgi:phenylalanyl-tRNA synthetase beta chain
VTVPTHRLDVEGLADLAEEVARMYGYDRIPATYPAGTQVGGRTPGQAMALKARRLLRGLGQTEVMTYSFCSPRHADSLRMPADDPSRRTLALLAPLSEEWSIMRPALLGGILEVLATNARRGTSDAAVFELDPVYRPVDGHDLPEEPLHLAGGLMGALAPRFWGGRQGMTDFYDLKGLIEALLAGLGIADVDFAAATHPSLHPGRCAALLAPGGAIIGHLGEAHPRVAAAYDLKGPVYLYELDFDRLRPLASADPQVKSPPRFPAIPRDLAVVVPEDLALAGLEEQIKDLGGNYLERAELFDVYTGPQVGGGQKSMAFSLVFRAVDRTLTDAEIDAVMERIAAGLEAKHGARLR